MADGRVVLALDPDRASATRKVVEAMGMPDLNDKNVLIKPNFNTADPPPGSTHMDTLRTMVELVKEETPRKVAIGDRSGPAKTVKSSGRRGCSTWGRRWGSSASSSTRCQRTGGRG